MERRPQFGFHGTACFALALTLGCWFVPLGHAQEPSARQKVLEFNNATGNALLVALSSAKAPISTETKKMLADALAIAREKNQPLNYNAGIILGRLATAAKDLEAAEVFYRISMQEAVRLQSTVRIGESYGSLIDAFNDSKKYADAGRICKELLTLKTHDGKPRLVILVDRDPDGDMHFIKENHYDAARRLEPFAQRIYIQSLSRQKKYDEALKLADEIIKKRNDWRELPIKGRVLQEAGRYEDAAKVFEEIVDRVGKDAELSAEDREDLLEMYRYSLSSIFVDANQIDRASEILQKLIDGNPKNPSYYNDLGYIWADKNMRLNEAEKLIRKALELDRVNRKEKPEPGVEDRDKGAYLDSLGWVLYRQKRYKEAREVLLKAVEDKTSQHLEIYDHLGDACKELGDRQGAVEAWRKGLEAASDSRRDQERKVAVEKKLEQFK